MWSTRLEPNYFLCVCLYAIGLPYICSLVVPGPAYSGAVLCSLSLYLSPLCQVTAKTLTQHDELMKKTETMSILMETNKLLREEKDKMQQDLEQTQAKVPPLTPQHYPG